MYKGKQRQERQLQKIVAETQPKQPEPVVNPSFGELPCFCGPKKQLAPYLRVVEYLFIFIQAFYFNL